MNDRRTGRVLAGGVAFLWIVIVVATYYAIHKPFGAANALALGQAFAAWGGAALVMALGTGIGLLFLSKVDFFACERLIWAAALGLGVVSVVTLSLGALGLLRPWLLWALTLIGLCAFFRPLRDAVSALAGETVWHVCGRFETFLALYCVTMLAVALVWALTPPTAWDSLVYHLTAPKLYLEAGRVLHPIDLPYLGFPQLTEMLFAWGIALTGERTAAAIHWFCGVFVAMALVGAGGRWLSRTAGWVTAGVFLSARTMVLLAGWAYVDLVLLLYATLAFFTLVRWTQDGAKVWLVLTGVLGGLALSTKYTALALLPALVVALLILGVRGRQYAVSDLWLAVRSAFLLCAVALLVWLPWLTKNLVLTGNPTYPFFFGGIHWDAWRSWWYDRPGTGLAFTVPWRLLTAPWDTTIWGVEGGAGYSATIGPLYLVLLPLLLLVWRRFSPARRRWLGAAAGFCGVVYGFWLWGVARTALLVQTRLLFPVFGLLALMAGAAVEGLKDLARRPIRLDWLTRAVVVGVLTLTLIGTLLAAARDQPLQVLLGFESEEDFLARRLGWYAAAIEQINQELPEESVVLFLWEPRSYHCAKDCLPDALLDRWLHTIYLHGRNSDSVASAWREEGITHVLLHRAGLDLILEAQFDPVLPEDLDLLDRLQDEHLSLMESFGSAYELYRLKDGL
jgi:4-amino-4-deoxy-L-arabinose transferase-like glycosyltransferase